MMISLVSCDSARAMLTICLLAAESVPTSAVAEMLPWPSLAISSLARLLVVSPVDDTARGMFVAQEDVLRDAEPVDDVEFLVHRGDAHPRAATGLAIEIGSPCQWISPLSGWCVPESVLIRVDLPAPFWPSTQCTSPGQHLKVHALERLDAGESLGE